MSGTGKYTFTPNAPMNKAMICSVLMRMSEDSLPDGAKNPFVDVQAGVWYYNATVWASHNGIITDDDTHKFNSNHIITRGEMAKIINTYLKKKNIPLKPVKQVSPFKDGDKFKKYYFDDVYDLNSYGIMNGMPDGNFYPERNVTRAEFAVILNNLSDLTQN